jgi:ABC-type glycerol-3-phosphate transport system substrate-binding protein
MAGPLSAWGVSKETEHPDVVRDWLEFVSQPEQNRWYSEQTGGVSMVDYVEANLPESLSAFVPLLEEGMIAPYHQNWPPGVAETVWGPGLQSLFLGDSSVDDVLSETDAAWDSAR